MKRLILLILLSTVATAQSNTVVQKLFTNAGSVPTPSPVNNIGQIGHAVYLTFTSKPAVSCTNPNATAQLEYSFDNSSWVKFGLPQTTSPQTQSSRYFFGSGLYNYIRFNLSAFDTTNCYATAWYTGSLNMPSPIQMQGQGTMPTTGTNQFPLVTCDQSTYKQIASGTPQTIGGAAPTRVCSLTASIAQAATSAILTVYDSTDAGCNGIVLTPLAKYNITPTSPITIGSGIGQLFATTRPYVCFDVSGDTVQLNATFTTGN